ncbi:curli assembly protein CsgF [Pontivivens ytuae]|uniref:Curli production assembly/transport component CsgF n=1 Tax=Pontivivens ytuae TaxID=2789856 RepID=A0A7S9LSG4_9RHOB|nr:curli assembly protein CsgF [Pontivivens ytuae]QPH53880.1 hypothetical protein I0K15_19235 [Pontivivens ytuae]
MPMPSLPTRLFATSLALALAATTAAAGPIVYRPINPGFGGFSDNADYLIALADIQNRFRDNGGGGGGGVPQISFPPITIDLGGAGGGGGATTSAAPAPAASSAAAPTGSLGPAQIQQVQP